MAKKAKKRKTAAELRGKGKEYEDRTDYQKIHTQWHKLTGLHSRLEWSAATIRAASACEIAANLAVRAEFKDRSNFSKAYVDSLLIWANGLDGKMKKLLLPMLSQAEKPVCGAAATRRDRQPWSEQDRSPGRFHGRRRIEGDHRKCPPVHREVGQDLRLILPSEGPEGLRRDDEA
jgi:hypothetical protein